MSGGSRVRLVKALTFSAETGAIVKHCFATTAAAHWLWKWRKKTGFSLTAAVYFWGAESGSLFCQFHNSVYSLIYRETGLEETINDKCKMQKTSIIDVFNVRH